MSDILDTHHSLPRWHRVVLLVVAGISSIILLLLSDIVLHVPLRSLDHAMLPLLMFGISGAFIRGVAFNPKNWLAKLVYSWPVIWILIIIGWAILLM